MANENMPQWRSVPGCEIVSRRWMSGGEQLIIADRCEPVAAAGARDGVPERPEDTTPRPFPSTAHFRAAGRANTPRRLGFAVIAASAVAAGVLLLGSGAVSPLASEAPEPAKAAPGTFRPTKEQWSGIKVGTVETMTFRPEELAEGNIAVDDDRSTPVFSPYTGRVVRLYAKLGDVVQRGAPLLAVEAGEIVQAQNDLITALANLRSARSQAGQGATNEKRAHELFLANGGSLKDWQQSQTDLATAQNTVHADEIALAAVRNRLRILGKSDREIAALEAQPAQRIDPVATVPAPIAGTVTQRQVGLGQYINSTANGASTPIFTIGDPSVVWLIANVREADAPSIHLGDPVEVRVLAFPGKVYNARVSWIAAAIDPNTHRLPVRADVDNPDGSLKPMMFANFSIITGASRQAPAVPQDAIVYEGEEARVWVVRDDRTIEARSIRPGRTSGGKVEILAGLTAGEKLVTGGTLFIDRAASGE